MDFGLVITAVDFVVCFKSGRSKHRFKNSMPFFKILKNEQISSYNFTTLMILSALAFVYLRMRIYSAWMIAESICICSGIGLYPKDSLPEPGHGPKDIVAYK